MSLSRNPSATVCILVQGQVSFEFKFRYFCTRNWSKMFGFLSAQNLSENWKEHKVEKRNSFTFPLKLVIFYFLFFVEKAQNISAFHGKINYKKTQNFQLTIYSSLMHFASTTSTLLQKKYASPRKPKRTIGVYTMRPYVLSTIGTTKCGHTLI